jgi:hypothetical protein
MTARLRASHVAVAMLSICVGATAVVALQRRATKPVARVSPTVESAVPFVVVPTLPPPEPLATLATVPAVESAAPVATTQPGNVAALPPPTPTTVSLAARAIRVSESPVGALSPMEVQREMARLRPTIEACYAAPECSSSSSPWCIDSAAEKDLDWRVFIGLDGHVDRVRHSGGGLQTRSCVGKALDAMRLSPYTLGANMGISWVTVYVHIQ